ncbi:MAG TPA: DUF3090 family protein [Caldilineae bacterium]|nr:DUF3090 family protein [Caldilineae bacterium]
MSELTYDFNPVSHITVETIGPPGQRTFYMQASQGLMLLTMVMEKEQAAALASAIDQLLEQIGADEEPDEEIDLTLHEPVDPEFRIGQMGLGYEETLDRVVIIVQELLPEEEAEIRDPMIARFWMSKAQARALSQHAAEVVAAGRPICPLCGDPINPTGHFCPRSNGHQRV